MEDLLVQDAHDKDLRTRNGAGATASDSHRIPCPICQQANVHFASTEEIDAHLHEYHANISPEMLANVAAVLAKKEK
jgi:hypothetical protein